MKRQQCLDGPAMIRDASGHRRCCPATGEGQTRMWRAKIIDCTNKIHAVLQRQRTARQRATSACQRGQTLTERGVEPLDVGRIDDPVALRAPSERLDACRRAIDNAAFGLDHPSPCVALEDLGDQDMAPGTQPGSSTRARVYGIAEGLPNGSDGGHQAISTDQQGTMCRAAPHAFDQALLHRLPLDTCPPYPGRDGPLINPERHDDGLEGAALRQQGHDERHGVRRRPQTIQRGAVCRREGLTARRADVPFLLLRMDANVALADLASGRTRQIGAEYRGGVHDDSPLLVVLGSMPRRSMSGPPFSLQPYSTTVKCGATFSKKPVVFLILPAGCLLRRWI